MRVAPHARRAIPQPKHEHLDDDRVVGAGWQRIDRPSLNLVITGFFMRIRFYRVFALLAPTLALHWTLKRLDRTKH